MCPKHRIFSLENKAWYSEKVWIKGYFSGKRRKINCHFIWNTFPLLCFFNFYHNKVIIINLWSWSTISASFPHATFSLMGKKNRKETKQKNTIQANNKLINVREVYWRWMLAVTTPSNIPLLGLVLWRDCAFDGIRNSKILPKVQEMPLFWCYILTGFMKQELIQKDKQSVMPIILIALENVYI